MPVDIRIRRRAKSVVGSSCQYKFDISMFYCGKFVTFFQTPKSSRALALHVRHANIAKRVRCCISKQHLCIFGQFSILNKISSKFKLSLAFKLSFDSNALLPVMSHRFKGETCIPPSPSPSHKDTKQVGLGQGFSSNTTETEKIKALQACTFDATSSNDFRPWRQNV